MLHKQIEILSRYIPVEAAEHVALLIRRENIMLKISAGRVSKMGDFRSARNGLSHRVSVNGNLNIYAFLLVFLHELAHVQVWEQYNSRVAAHGKEWKNQFGLLIREFVDRGFFHPCLKAPLIEFSYNIKATGLGHPGLTKALSLFDKENDQPGAVFLEELPVKSIFQASNGRHFRKEDRLRKRYRCLCLENNRKYLFHPMAKVVMIENVLSV